MVNIVIFLSITLIINIPGLYAEAAEKEIISLGQFGSWTVYKLKDKGKIICYMTAIPHSSTSKTPRPQARLMVTHRPTDKVSGEVNIHAGTDLSPSPHELIIKKKGSYKLFSKEQRAWSFSPEEDMLLVKDLKAGSEAEIHLNANGETFTDTYSLRGFTKAYEAITKACS